MPYFTPLYNQDIIDFLSNNITPLDHSIYGSGYRAAVTLIDGTYLPCVIFYNSKTIVDQAIKRFDEERKGWGIFSKSSEDVYRDIVKNFVTLGNCINYFDIGKIEISPYAFPKTVLKQIHGETLMGWTGFVARMKDGNYFSFGSSFRFQFFDMPTGYTVDDIDKIINHSYINETGQIQKITLQAANNHYLDNVYREKAHFECYIDNL